MPGSRQSRSPIGAEQYARALECVSSDSEATQNGRKRRRSRSETDLSSEAEPTPPPPTALAKANMRKALEDPELKNMRERQVAADNVAVANVPWPKKAIERRRRLSADKEAPLPVEQGKTLEKKREPWTEEAWRRQVIQKLDTLERTLFRQMYYLRKAVNGNRMAMPPITDH